MALLKRIFFFSLVNIFIVLTLSIVFSVAGAYFGIDPSSYQGLILWCAMLGMGGSFISLRMSKWMAKTFHKVQIIDNKINSPHLQRIVQKVHEYSRRSGLKTMPEVGIYESPEINAFATGPSRNNSLVALSSGIIGSMNEDELDGVIAHEVAHIANGDMVTMTLLQGVINTMVLFLAHIISRIIAQNSDREGGGSSFLVYYGLQIVLGLLGSIVVNYFSRWREFRADAGSAKVAGKDKMIAGLRKLQHTMDYIEPEDRAVASLKISNKPGLFAALFSTHPPLEERIRRLERGQY